MLDQMLRRAALMLLAVALATTALSGCKQPVKIFAAAPSHEAPDSRDPDRLWCNEHRVYEDECLICHPELAGQEAASLGVWCPDCKVYHSDVEVADTPREPGRLWCNEHGLYEDECLICHPELADLAPSERVASPLWCNEHDLAEMECGACQPQLLQEKLAGEGMKLRVASPEKAFRAGIELGRPLTAMRDAEGEILGKVSYNRNAWATVTPLAEGVVSEILADVGAAVDQGEVLAWVNAPNVAEAKSAYLQALTDRGLKAQLTAREKDLVDRKISARQDYEQASAALSMSQSETARAKQRLLDLGLSEGDIAEVAQSKSATSLLPVRAPFAGTIVERTAVRGAAVVMGEPLFEIADLSTMWMELSVTERMLSTIGEGVPIVAQFEAFPGEQFAGQIAWVAFNIDQATGTVQARATLENSNRQLRHGMFGKAALTTSSAVAASSLAVPSPAIQMVDGRPVVFTHIDEGLFEARVVELGSESGGNRIVLAGLRPDDELVVEESYLLKSEFLKARLGAGCADH